MPKPQPAFVLPPRDVSDVVVLGDYVHLATALQNEQKDDVIAYRSRFGSTALHYAALQGHLHICQLLLDNGADVNAVNDNRDTPLHLAAQGGFTSIVKLLVESGHADTSIVNNDFKPALQLASDGKYGNVVHFLSSHVLPKVAGTSDALVAASTGDVLYLSLQYFFYGTKERDALGIVETENGDSILNVAAKTAELTEKHLDVMRFLLKYKICNVNRANKQQLTPLMYAARSNHAEAIDLLLANGADATIAVVPQQQQAAAATGGDEEPAQTATTFATNKKLKLILDAAEKKMAFDHLYNLRNSVSFADRPDHIQLMKSRKKTWKEADAALAAVYKAEREAEEAEEEARRRAAEEEGEAAAAGTE